MVAALARGEHDCVLEMAENAAERAGGGRGGVRALGTRPFGESDALPAPPMQRTPANEALASKAQRDDDAGCAGAFDGRPGSPPRRAAGRRDARNSMDWAGSPMVTDCHGAEIITSG